MADRGRSLLSACVSADTVQSHGDVRVGLPAEEAQCSRRRGGGVRSGKKGRGLLLASMTEGGHSPTNHFQSGNGFFGNVVRGCRDASPPMEVLKCRLEAFSSEWSSKVSNFVAVSSRRVEDARRRHRPGPEIHAASVKGFMVASAQEGDGKLQRRGRRGSAAPGGALQLVSTTVAAQPQKSFLRNVIDGMIAGGTAGVVVETALYPIDTIKTRLQAARAGGGIVFKGLYSGLAGNLVGVLPASAIFVGVYEPLKQKLLRTLPDHLSSVAHLVSGAAGGAAASLVRVPTEVVKQRMQTGQFASAHGAVRTIIAKEGIRGLYAGFGSFLLRDLPFDAIQFCLYEQLKIAYSSAVGRELYDSEVAIIGATAGATTGAVTTPLDLVKTRLMTQGTTGQYKNIVDCVAKIVKEEGAATLFKGVGPRVLWIGIGGSIFFGVLEKTKELLGQAQPPPRALDDGPAVV